MRKLLRAVVICVLTWSATSTGGAETLGDCLIRCTSSSSTPAFVVVTVYNVSESECCEGYDFYCPPGYTGSQFAWNGSRCPL
jgi:hypothetical protein